MLIFFPGDSLPGLYCCCCSWGILPLAVEIHTCWVGFRAGDWLGHCRIFLFLALKSLGLRSQYSVHCPSALWSAVRWVFKNLKDLKSIWTCPQGILLLLSAVTSWINRCPHYNTTSTKLHKWVHIMSSSILFFQTNDGLLHWQCSPLHSLLLLEIPKANATLKINSRLCMIFRLNQRCSARPLLLSLILGYNFNLWKVLLQIHLCGLQSQNNNCSIVEIYSTVYSTLQISELPAVPYGRLFVWILQYLKIYSLTSDQS